MLIESLLEAGMSFRTISSIALCSHGSVSAQKKEWLAKKAALKLLETEKQKPAALSTATEHAPVLIGEIPPAPPLTSLPSPSSAV